MDAMLSYLANMPDLHKILWLAICLSGASLVEFVIPLVRQPYNRLRHLRTNLFFLLTTFIVNGLFSLILVKSLPVLQANKIGLFYWISLPTWLELLVALVILDLLAQYTIHYLLHKVPWLWRFHQVHHSDTNVDATTGTRHHPVDYFAREVFSLMTVVLLGVPLSYYLFYRLITVFCTYFTHSNIQLPGGVDAALSKVIVTPNAHKFHHHFQAPWTDRNYGQIFVFWDKIFGTFVYGPTDPIRYGVDTMDDAKSDQIGYLLVTPFKHNAGTRRSSD